MKYSLFILKSAQKDLAKCPINIYNRIRDSIRSLADNPRPKNSRKLVGRDGWRIRIGDYRVIYGIDDKQRKVIVLLVGHRKDIYR